MSTIRQALRSLAKTPGFTVVALLTLAAFIATIVPARRATKVDPMVALRAE